MGIWRRPNSRFQLRGVYLRRERKQSSLECWDKSNAFTSPRHVEDCTKLSLTKAEWTRHIPAYDVVDCYALLTQQARALLDMSRSGESVGQVPALQRASLTLAP